MSAFKGETSNRVEAVNKLQTLHHKLTLLPQIITIRNKKTFVLTCCVGHDEAPAESLVILNINVTPVFTDGLPQNSVMQRDLERVGWSRRRAKYSDFVLDAH